MNNPKLPGGAARSPQDIWGGLVLVLISAFALYMVQDLPASGRVGFASGTAPRLFGYGLLGLGLVVMIGGFLKEGPGIGTNLLPILLGTLFFFAVLAGIDYALNLFAKSSKIVVLDKLSAVIGFLIAGGLVAWINGFPKRDRFGIQGPLTIVGSVLFFAFAIRDLGLAVTGIPVVLIASFASKDAEWKEALIFGAAITAFCAMLFPIALGQPIPLWPTF